MYVKSEYLLHKSKKKRFYLVRLLGRAVTALTIILFVGFLIVAPLDILSHALKKQQFLDFFITIGGIVVVVILNLYWFLYRFFTVKQILKYIPKNYIPVFTSTPTIDNMNTVNEKVSDTKRVLIHSGLYNLTWDTFDITAHLNYYYNYSKNTITFNNGVFPPKKTFDNFHVYNDYHTDDENLKYKDDALPFMTNYDSVIKAFSQDISFSSFNENYRNFFTSEMNFLENKGYTFLDYVKKIHFQCGLHNIDTSGFDFVGFCRFYQRLRYHGRTANLKWVSEKDFLSFMKLTLHFYKIKQAVETAVEPSNVSAESDFDGYDYYSHDGGSGGTDDSLSHDAEYRGTDDSYPHDGGSRSTADSYSKTGDFLLQNGIGEKSERNVFNFESSNDDESQDDDIEYADDLGQLNDNAHNRLNAFKNRSRLSVISRSPTYSSRASFNSVLSDVRVAPIKKRTPSPRR